MVPLLRKETSVERIVLQKSSPGIRGNRVLSGLGLPRGVRKKVTTSLFAIACLFLMNISLSTLCESFTTSAFGGAQNVGVVSSSECSSTSAHNCSISTLLLLLLFFFVDYGSGLMKTPLVGGRTLLSIPPAVEAVQPATNRTNTSSSSVGYNASIARQMITTNKTSSNANDIASCLPDDFFSPQGEPVGLNLSHL